MFNCAYFIAACLIVGQAALPSTIPVALQPHPAVPTKANTRLPDEAPSVAIIIDDIGYQGRLGEAAIWLPGPYAVAVMPFAPHSKRLASLAVRANKNVILHLPMEAYTKNHLLGQGALFSHMGEQEVHAALKAALESLPQAIGVNNHMGSLLTSRRESMDNLMTAIANYDNLFFVDSKTSGRSAARLAASAKGVTSVERDVFLDNKPIRAHIRKQLSRLVARAKKHGHALAIGHPYPATLATLRAWDPTTFGVQLISLREYVAKVQPKKIISTP